MSFRRRRPWTSAEDAAVCALVEEMGVKRWQLVSEGLRGRYKIEGRSGKQCRERWHNHLDPTISNSPWTRAEDLQLLHLQQHMGNRWADMAALLPGRTDNSIKNRFYSTNRKRLHSSSRRNRLKRAPASRRQAGVRETARSKTAQEGSLVVVRQTGSVEEIEAAELLLYFARSGPEPGLGCPTPLRPANRFESKETDEGSDGAGDTLTSDAKLIQASAA